MRPGCRATFVRPPNLPEGVDSNHPDIVFVEFSCQGKGGSIRITVRIFD